MNKSVEIDLGDLANIMDSFIKRLDRMKEQDVIDLAARLKPVSKACETIDKYAKEHVKSQLKHKEGTVLGGLFKAVLKLVNTNRLDQGRLKEERPQIYEAFLKECVDERITYEVR